MQFRPALLLVAVSLFSSAVTAQTVPGSLDMHWQEGAADCKSATVLPLQVHRYDDRTFILRENLCTTFEAPFLYLLVGSAESLLIDTGDVADPRQVPLADTVTKLIPPGLKLLVVHTHRHLDHRAGDPQFAALPNVEVVGYDIDSVKRFYGFADWPNGTAQIDLGGRVVDVLPTPGHNETHVSFYDRNTALFFSGDFMMPARLLIDDTDAERATARRVADFVLNRPVNAVLGGHIEFDEGGEPYSWGATYHPHEHSLPLSKADLLALPDALRSYNGFYTRTGPFLMMNQMRVLIAQLAALLAGAIVVIAGLVIATRRYLRRRRVRASALAGLKQAHKG